MTWSYDIALVATKDQVRFLVGDTDTADQLTQDEEIVWALTEQGNVYGAASLVASTLATRFGRQVDKSVGDLKLKFGERAERYTKLSEELKKRVLGRSRLHTTGAESIASKRVDRQDTDLVDPFFTRNTHRSTRRSNRNDPGPDWWFEEDRTP